MDNIGRTVVYKYTHATSTSESFFLWPTSVEGDDHDNPAITFLPNGRVVAAYSMHNDTSGFRYRISTNPEDISAWGPEVVVSPGGDTVAYTRLQYLSSVGRYYNVYRANIGRRRIISTADFVTWDTARDCIRTGLSGDYNCYTQGFGNGVDRIDFFWNWTSPNNGAGLPTTLFHAYMMPSGTAGVENFYSSDGTLIGTNGSLNHLTGTVVYDGNLTNGEGWVWNITRGADGYPRVLFVRFETLNDHRYMYGRWTGSAWVTTQICLGGDNLSTNITYSGGLCFDAQNENIVYASVQVGSSWEIQEWRTANNGATWSKFRDITTGSASGVKNARPVSPRNHAGQAAVVWWSGTYANFYNFNTAAKGIGSA